MSYQGHKFYSDVWVDLNITVPAVGYTGGYWKLQYVLAGNTLPADRLTITLTAKGAPVTLKQ